MPPRSRILISLVLLFTLIVISSCGNPYPQPEALTPIPTLAPAGDLTLATELQEPAEPAGEVAVPTPVPEVAAGDPANGATIFEINCLACHGEGAAGGAVGPTLISAEMAAKDDDHYRQTLINGVEGTAMAAWAGRLSPQEIEDVIAYLRSLQ